MSIATAFTPLLFIVCFDNKTWVFSVGGFRGLKLKLKSKEILKEFQLHRANKNN